MLEKVLIPEIYLPIIYTCIVILVYGLLKRIIDKVVDSKQRSLKRESYNYKKAETFKVILKNLCKYILIIFLILSILTVFGFDVSSVLAGLGIAGLIIGLSLQDLAKDIISGITIILENQYAMGDIISINNFKGEVVFLGLKTTRVKNWEGQTMIIANRNINEVINYSMSSSVAIVDIDVNYDENLEKVENILTELADNLTKTLPSLKGDVELLGINDMTSYSVRYRMTVLTYSMEHHKVQRLMRKEIREALTKNNIKVPYNKIEVQHG